MVHSWNCKYLYSKYLFPQILFYNSNFNLESKSVPRIPIQVLDLQITYKGKICAGNEYFDFKNRIRILKQDLGG